MKSIALSLALLLSLSAPVVAQVTTVPNVMSFQGRIATPDGNPVLDGTYSIRFSLWDAVTNGTEKWEQTISNVTVMHGVFAVRLADFPTGTFDGDTWLEIKIGEDAPLSPRQQLVSAPYALKAGSVADGAITGASISAGTITADKLAFDISNSLAWLLGGNAGTDPAAHFLGTTDNQPLEFRINNVRGLRLEYIEFGNATAVNVLGGAWFNRIAPDVYGATIAGGGIQVTSTGEQWANIVTEHGGTIGGGYHNQAGNDNADTGDAPYPTVAGGYLNRATGYGGTIGGGNNNRASGLVATIAGGGNHLASGYAAFIGGGANHVASGFHSVIGGGVSHTASGSSGTVPGGYRNVASAFATLAAGNNAIAAHDGAFVWGDSTDSDFNDANNVTSTAPNQFVVRAVGGVKLTAGTTLELGFGTAKETSAGKIGYGTFTANTLDIVGAGTSAGIRKVKIWAEGGTTFAGNINVNGTTYTSDSRFKRNVAPLPNALEMLLNLCGVVYEWDTMRWKDKGFAAGKQLGFLAQEVEQIFPELVTTDIDGYKAVNYVGVIPVLVEAIKSLKAQKDTELKTLQARITQSEAENAELRARLERIEAALEIRK